MGNGPKALRTEIEHKNNRKEDDNNITSILIFLFRFLGIFLLLEIYADRLMRRIDEFHHNKAIVRCIRLIQNEYFLRVC